MAKQLMELENRVTGYDKKLAEIIELIINRSGRRRSRNVAPSGFIHRTRKLKFSMGSSRSSTVALCQSAWRAVRARTGSTTTTSAPRFCASAMIGQ